MPVFPTIWEPGLVVNLTESKFKYLILLLFILIFILVDCNVPVPIDQYPTFKGIDAEQLQSILIGDVSTAAGPCGKPNASYQFSGADGSYIKFPDNPGALDELQNSITVLCWVYFSEPVPKSGCLINFRPNSFSKVLVNLQNASLFAHFSGSREEALELRMEKSLESSQWHYVGASYNDGTRNARLWVNGTIVKENKGGEDWTLDLAVDSTYYSESIISGNNFKGRISAMQVYNDYLTREQIDAVKYATAPGKNVIALTWSIFRVKYHVTRLTFRYLKFTY